MSNYLDSKKALIEYVKSADYSSNQLRNFLRFKAPGLVLDFDQIAKKRFDMDGKKLVNIIIAMNEVKVNFEQNRPRTKLPEHPEFDLYKEKYKQQIEKNRLPNYSLEKFYEIYKAFTEITLSPIKEIENIETSTFKFVDFIQKAILEDETLMKFTCDLLINDVSLLNEIYDKMNAETANKFLKLFNKERKSGSLKQICLNLFKVEELKKHYDFSLENHFIYYEFASNFMHHESSLYEGAVVVEPSLFFVLKWISDESMRDVNVLFLVDDKERLAFFEKYFEEKNQKIHFDCYENATEYKSSFNDLTTNILVFGSHCADDVIKEIVIGILQQDFIYDKFLVYDVDEYFYDRSVAAPRIQLLPERKVNKNRFKRSMLITYLSRDYDAVDVELIHYSLLKNAVYQSISPKFFKGKIDYHLLDDPSIKFRTLFKEGFDASLKKTNKQRNVAIPFRFSEEITIYYRVSFDEKNQSYRVGAYLIDPESDKKLQLENTLKTCRKKSIEDIPNWLNNEYLYSQIRKKGTTVSIYDEVLKVYKTHYKKCALTLKTFVYFYEKLLFERFGERQFNFLKRVQETILGKNLIDNMSSFVVNHELDSMFELELDDNKKKQCKAILSSVIDLAIEKKHATRNLIKQEVKEESNRNSKAFYQSREHLAIKYFSETENKKLYKTITRNMEKDILYLGVYIKLLTGLESNVVCALQWKDFVTFDSQTKYYLLIRKQLVNDGSSFTKFSKRESYRKVPCCDELSTVLLNHKQKKLEELHLENEEYLNSMAIVEGNDATIQGATKVVAPVRLSRFSNKLVKKLRKDYSLKTNIPDAKKGTIETDFLNFGGDIFKNNYRHYGIYKAKFNEGELDYLQGRQSDLPFSRNYCDYGNEAAQMILQIKQNRFVNIFKKESEAYAKEIIIKKENEVYKSTESTDKLTELSLRIHCKDGERVTLEINSEYGIDVSCMAFKGDRK